MQISVVAVMAAFGVKLGPRWSQVRALLEPSWTKLGLLEGVWGAMLGSKIGLGSPLGVILRPCWAQEPITTPKAEAPEPIKTPKSEEMGL